MAKQTFTTGQVLTAAQVNSLQANDFNQTVSAKTASYVLVASDKGTRIEFNTSGSVTCTVNTGLFDAGDTVYIQNRGAGVVTITAGTATVNTSASLAVNQWEGGLLYFISASAAIWYEYASTANGDITGVTAGTGISGGGTSGDVTITNTMATAIDAKGDLVAGTADNTFARLAVGSNGETLVADSSTSTGLRYNPPVGSLGNPIINGGMDIAQRGTSFTTLSSSAYTLDRWKVQTPSNNATVTQDTADVPSGFRYALKFAATGTLTGYTYQMGQQIEFNNCYYLQNKTVTISFYAKAANTNAASTNCILRTRTIAGVDGACLFTGTNVDNNVTITTSWARYAVTLTLPSSFGSFSVEWVNGNTAASGDGCSITGFQIDLGTWTASTAPAFRRSGNTLAGELAACQRYYQRISGGNDIVGSGQWTTTTSALIVVPNKVTMRTAPAISATVTNFNVTNSTGGAIVATAVSGVVTGVTNQLISVTTAGSGSGGNGTTCFTNGANGILEMSSEL